MATTLTSTGITFPDSTTQTTAATGRSGGTTTSSAVDITLTSSSDQVQSVSMTATNKAVILPNATTLTEGVAVFQIVNSGANVFSIKNADSAILASVSPGQSVLLTLVDNSTSAGKWANAITYFSTSMPAFGVSSSGSASADLRIAALSSSLVVIGYDDGASNAYLIAASISGSTVTWGSPVSVLNTSGASINVIQGMSSTQGFVGYSYYSGGNSANYCRGFSVSGTTITLGTQTTLQSNSLNVPCVVTGAYTQGGYCVFTYRGYSYNGYIRTATISGTTLTLGAASNVAPGGYNCSAVKLDETRSVVAYNNDSGYYFRVATLSGSGFSLGTAYSSGSGIWTEDYAPYLAATDVSQGSGIKVVTSGTSVTSATAGLSSIQGFQPVSLNGAYYLGYSLGTRSFTAGNGYQNSPVLNAFFDGAYFTALINANTQAVILDAATYKIASPVLQTTGNYIGLAVYQVA